MTPEQQRYLQGNLIGFGVGTLAFTGLNAGILHVLGTNLHDAGPGKRLASTAISGGVVDGAFMGYHVYQRTGDRTLATDAGLRRGALVSLAALPMFLGMFLVIAGGFLGLLAALEGATGFAAWCVPMVLLGVLLFWPLLHVVRTNRQITYSGHLPASYYARNGYVSFGRSPDAWVRPAPGVTAQQAILWARQMAAQAGVDPDDNTPDLDYRSNIRNWRRLAGENVDSPRPPTPDTSPGATRDALGKWGWLRGMG